MPDERSSSALSTGAQSVLPRPAVEFGPAAAKQTEFVRIAEPLNNERQAAAAGLSLSDYALQELERIAGYPPAAEVLSPARCRAGVAEALGVSLVTCDRRLSEAPGHAAQVEVFAQGPGR